MPAATFALALAFAMPRSDWPATCPEADDVMARVAALAGRVPGDGELDAHADVTGPPWRATIELKRGRTTERRDLEAGTCAALLDAYAVMVAVAIDPVGVTRQSVAPRIPLARPSRARAAAPAPAAASTSTPAPAPASSSAPAPARADPRPRAAVHRLGVRVGAGAGVGGWERASGAVELALAWSRNALELDLVGRYWIRRRDPLGDRGAVNVELGTVGALACWRGARRHVSLAGCAGIEAGDFVIQGVQAPARERVHFAWVAPLVGGRVAFEARAPLWLWLGLEAALPVTRLQATLRARPEVPVYDAGSPAVRGLAGIELRWTIRGRQ